ncbi:hypothetical protein BG011_004489 [Mortierella polycephala]|uniref:Zn(2)-C6 fungal-type domain-containing protein n=1 Tax=Mortierella polycephala TaxID=41804 RepID=A0A9P6Q0A1_9FUNG|nr:hypothetical protein BG011_004489 [Mortierella polycephala]
MTFFGLPSVRGPKQNHKGSASTTSTTSPSSAASSTDSASPTDQSPSNAITLPETTTGDKGVVNTTTVPSEPMMPSMIQSSFADLVQLTYHNNLSTDALHAAQTLNQQQQTGTPTTVTKKKTTPQTLSPAHSSSYRKRLNVNQVCDWCRYRKIRCDRESPCNSCQHSKRECIRTPPSILLSRQNAESDSSSTASGKTKRNRADTKDGRSHRASKSYRGSSISSHQSSAYNSLSSDDNGNDGDNEDQSSGSGAASLSPVAASLTLAGLGLTGLGVGLDHNLSLGARRDSDSQQISSSLMANMPLSGSTPQNQSNLQDQDHLERMRRIEMLLSNVIPGAADFIAHGTQLSLPISQQQQQQKNSTKSPLSVVTHGLDSQWRDMTLSPQEQRLANISLVSPGLASSIPLQEQQQQQSSTSSTAPSLDYLERMKRIELLLSAVQDQSLAKVLIQGQPLSAVSLFANSVKAQKKLSKELKKLSKVEARTRNSINNNGTVVKRPHVAAGFAGQKPPPKLPQAIAEAAQKKQASRKKRVSAAAARNAAKAAAAASTNTTAGDNLSTKVCSTNGPAKASLENTVLPPSTASLEIPSVIDHHDPLSFVQHQHHGFVLEQPEQQQYGLQMNQRGSAAFQQRQHTSQAFYNYQQQQQTLAMPDVSSVTIPLSSPIASYGSLVVPASSSTCSSVTSSPRSSRAETVSINGTDQDKRSMSVASEDTIFSGPYAQFQQHQGSPMPTMGYTPASHPRDFETGFSLVDHTQGAHIHQFADQQQSLQQQDDFTDLGLNMNDSLENLMKKSLGSLDMPMQPLLQGVAPSSSSSSPSSSSTLDPSLFALLQSTQLTYLQQQHQHQHRQQQRRQSPMAFHDMSKSMWIPTSTASFNDSSPAEFPWPQHPQQLQSINISANHSPDPESESELDLENSDNHSALEQQLQQQQQELSAHALFQQQHQQQQRRHMEELQRQQQQMRKNPMALDLQHQHTLHQHRASITHQHHQSFYIPQVQDDDEEEEDGLQTSLDHNIGGNNNNNNNNNNDNNSKNSGAATVGADIWSDNSSMIQDAPHLAVPGASAA